VFFIKKNIKKINAKLQFYFLFESPRWAIKLTKCMIICWAYAKDLSFFWEESHSFSIHSTSLAVTKEILVSFYFYAALTNMLKFSAYPRLSWWITLYIKHHFFLLCVVVIIYEAIYIITYIINNQLFGSMSSLRYIVNFKYSLQSILKCPRTWNI